MEKKGIKKSKNTVITRPESSVITTLFEQLKYLSGFNLYQNILENIFKILIDPVITMIY